MNAYRLIALLGALLMILPEQLSAAPDTAEKTDRVLTDFTQATADLGWYVVNDNVMGGRSRGGFTRKATSLYFAGSTNTNGGGFSSIRTRSMQMDLSSYDGIRVRIKGDGRRYTWRLTTDARWRRRQISYWADFETKKGEWTETRIPFSSFKPQFRGIKLAGPKLDPARITGMGLMIYDKKDGPFELHVDSVHAYRAQPAFSLSTYRLKKRVLVLAAPATSDERLRKQLADIEETRRYFEERDMVLVLALEEAGSKAGRSRLTREQARGVRATLDADAGSFKLALIGKDGGVKHRASKPVEMTELYVLIDSMPIRRAEQLGR